MWTNSCTCRLKLVNLSADTCNKVLMKSNRDTVKYYTCSFKKIFQSSPSSSHIPYNYYLKIVFIVICLYLYVRYSVNTLFQYCFSKYVMNIFFIKKLYMYKMSYSLHSSLLIRTYQTIWNNGAWTMYCSHSCPGFKNAQF